MKTMIVTVTTLVSLLICFASFASAEVATEREALNVAKNWVARIVAKTGAWGDAPSARVTGIQPLKYKGRALGYYCPVEPEGYLVVSLHKELALVKAYSETGRLDLASDEGATKLLKSGLARMIDSVEKKLGKLLEDATKEELSKAVKVNYRPVWDDLAVDPADFQKLLASGAKPTDLQQVGPLLHTYWHQYEPYSDHCLELWCDFPLPGTRHASLGASAVAGAQIMRYWHWPPYGTSAPYGDDYDWVSMPNELTEDSTEEQIDAVAELCYEFGTAIGTGFVCFTPCYPPISSRDAFVWYFRYDDAANLAHYYDHSAQGWFEMVKAQLNENRPVYYQMYYSDLWETVVIDGWRESGDPIVREWHMNYGTGRDAGGGVGYNHWYIQDEQWHASPPNETMIEDIVPEVALGPTLSGTYPKEVFIYRYFDQNASTSANTIFAAGQRLQFLPNVTATSSTGTVRFEGATADMTTLFTRGDLDSGARVIDGVIRLKPGGSVVLR